MHAPVFAFWVPVYYQGAEAFDELPKRTQCPPERRN
jgi:hypothetical protein